jgi:hypothetical protein
MPSTARVFLLRRKLELRALGVAVGVLRGMRLMIRDSKSLRIQTIAWSGLVAPPAIRNEVQHSPTSFTSGALPGCNTELKSHLWL